MADLPVPAEFPRARLRPLTTQRRLAALLVLLAGVLGGGVLVAPEMLGMVALVGLLSLPVGALALWTFRRNRHEGEGLRASEEGLWLGSELVFRRSELRRAMVVVERGEVVVVLQTSSAMRLVDVTSEEEGNALVRALALDPTRTTSEFRFDARAMRGVPAWVFWAYLFVPLMLIPLLLTAFYVLVPLLMVVWYAGLVLGALPSRLSVGLDGLMVRWLWKRRLVRFEQLRAVESDERELSLVLRSGERIELSAYWTGQPWEGGRWRATTGLGSRKAYVDAVAARVRAAQASSGTREEGVSAWLGRRGHDTRSWLRELRSMLASARADFRREAPDPEQLWSTLEDARQPPLVRVAAATALGPGLDEGGRARLRVASSAVVEPALRAALEASGSEDEEALLRAVQALEGQPARRRL